MPAVCPLPRAAAPHRPYNPGATGSPRRACPTRIRPGDARASSLAYGRRVQDGTEMTFPKLVVVAAAAVVFVVIPAVMLYWRLATAPTPRGGRRIALKAFAIGVAGCLGTCRWVDASAAAAVATRDQSQPSGPQVAPSAAGAPTSIAGAASSHALVNIAAIVSTGCAPDTPSRPASTKNGTPVIPSSRASAWSARTASA